MNKPDHPAGFRVTVRAVAIVLLLGLAASSNAEAQKRADSAIVTSAKSLISEGLSDSAIQLITVALDADSSNTMLLFSLADAQSIAGKKQARRSTLARILRVHKRSVPARIALAEDFFSANQLDSAAFFANEAALNSGGSSAEAYYWLARTHERAGRADSAYSYYLRAWSAQPFQELF
jgi:tetratricopeptide (TPR) repeat protein